MIEIPVYLVIVQWVLLLVLGSLLMVLCRQLAVARRTTTERGTNQGGAAPAFDYLDARRPGVEHRFVPGADTPALIVFADPSCPGGENAMIRLQIALDRRESLTTGVLVVTTEPAGYVARNPLFAALGAPIGLIAEETRQRWKVEVTPYFFAVGADGTVTASGPAWTVAQIGCSLGERRPRVLH
jgi:hypothetical protein